MKSSKLIYIKNILIPCLVFSSVTGILTGGLIFAFKSAVGYVLSISSGGFGFVRENPVFIPLLLACAAAVGLVASLILRKVPNLRGGGIPTAIAILRGLIDFSWIKSIFLLFFSALLSYLCGMPLGNEGPSVQMGTAVGRGTVRLFGKSNQAWDRYIMTGGACAGFAAATGAPLSGIFFAFEEAHRRFSPMIFMSAATTVIAATATSDWLSRLFGGSISMFDFSLDTVLPLGFIWSAAVVGIVCGGCAILFTKVYRSARLLITEKLTAVPFTLRIVLVFVLVAAVGLASASFLGSGHSLIDEILEGHGAWYMLIIYFCVRAILLIIASNAGVTGGLFIPTLAFGAVIGALCGKAMIALGVLPSEYYAVMVIIGMSSFMGASSRTPIMAITFSAEALSGMTNILPVVFGVTVAFLVIEVFGVEAFTDTVIEGKIEQERHGKKAKIVDAYLTVKSGSFVVGKEIRDILWPPTCTVLSVKKSGEDDTAGIGTGDVLHLHYQTFDPDKTLEILEHLVGNQDKDTRMRMHNEKENQEVPEL